MTMHTELAEGRWQRFPLVLQLAHVGSEVSRGCKAKNMGNDARLRSAVLRALELFDLTIADPKNRNRLRELCRAREVACDFLVGENRYHSTAESLDRYFLQFATASKRALELEEGEFTARFVKVVKRRSVQDSHIPAKTFLKKLW